MKASTSLTLERINPIPGAVGQGKREPLGPVRHAMALPFESSIMRCAMA